MQRQVVITGDGSSTLFVPDLGDHYHSVHGALRESLHVFIGNGLERCRCNPITILEVGFGTGLNAWLTLLAASEKGLSVNYETWDAWPLEPDLTVQLNYPQMMGYPPSAFQSLHRAPWGSWNEAAPGFRLLKVQGDIRSFDSDSLFDLVYFDAFGPSFQPELWETAVFARIGARMPPGGILVTYSAKGQVRRNLREAGFVTEKAPGPPGKREITIAIRTT